MNDCDVDSPTNASDCRDARIEFPFDSSTAAATTKEIIGLAFDKFNDNPYGSEFRLVDPADFEPGDDKFWITLQSR